MVWTCFYTVECIYTRGGKKYTDSSLPTSPGFSVLEENDCFAGRGKIGKKEWEDGCACVWKRNYALHLRFPSQAERADNSNHLSFFSFYSPRLLARP